MATEQYEAEKTCHCVDHSNPENTFRLGELIGAACAQIQPVPVLPPERDPVELALSLTMTFFPPTDYVIEKIKVEGDKIAVRWKPRSICCPRRTARPLIGKQEQPTGLTIMRYANGKIVEVRESWDRMEAETWAENGNLVA